MTRARRAALVTSFAVAIGAAVLTAHGLYAVAVSSFVPPAIAWLYPLITDGLAMVAYAATHQLGTAGKRYAWAVVLLAAALSAVAQAAFLAGGATFAVSPSLAFGVGAWPAIAAAIVAHLVYLLATPKPVPVPVVVVPEVVAPAVPESAPEPVVAEAAPRAQLRAVPAAKRVAMVKATASPDTNRLAAIVAKGGGRGTVAKELGVTLPVARTLLAKHRAGQS